MLLFALAALFFATPATENWQVASLRPDPARKPLAKKRAKKSRLPTWPTS